MELQTALLAMLAAGAAYGVSSMGNNSIDDRAFQEARSLLIAREGRRNDIYKDSLGKLTGGIGHLLTPNELAYYKLGDRVTDEQIEQWFQDDIAKAFAAAKQQALELQKYTPGMIAALTSVNFQLGTGWRSKFSNTWARIKSGKIQEAIVALNSSSWAKQTPTRVADFKAALQREFA